MTLFTQIADALQGIFHNADALAKKQSLFSGNAP